MDKLLSTVKSALENDKPAFIVEENKTFEDQKCDLYALRKAGMAGKDFIFVHDLDKIGHEKSKLEKLHEAARKYANSFYRMPKWFRFCCPNIVSIFISSKKLPQELANWAKEPTRTITGGEFHSVFFIDLNDKGFYGQGTSRTQVHGAPFIKSIEFKNINPQNRAFYLVAKVADSLLS